MEKPKITKQLAFIAMLFVCVNFLLNVIAILFPETYIWVYGTNIDASLSVGVRMLLLADAACVLPLGGVCFWSWRQTGISENSAMGTLILAVVCHFARALGVLLHYLMMRVAYSASEVAVFTYINNARNIFSFCILAALVLICCAASIELYITKSFTSKQ